MVEGVDRRRFARQRTASLTYIELGKNNGGIVLNLGEGGLALAAASPLSDSAMPQLRFRLPGSAAWIKTSAQTAWIGESRKEAGVAFLDLAEADRMSIREWLSAAESAELAAPAAPAVPALDGSQTEVPAAQPESEPLPEAPPDPASPALETTAAADLSAPVPATAPLPTFPSQVPQEYAKDPWIRVELRLHRWLVTAILVFLAALLSFFAGVLSERRSWTDHLREFVSRAVATVRSGNLESAQESPATQKNPEEQDTSGPDLAPDSRVASPAALPPAALPPAVPPPAVPPPTPQNEQEVATPPAVAASSAALPPSEPRDTAPLPQSEQPTPPPADRAPTQGTTHQANPANPPGNQAQTAAPAVALVPEMTPPAPAAVAAANPAPTAPPPLPTGSVEVNADPYPSIRIPPAQRDSTGRMPLRLGQLSTRVEPVYPQQALREGVQGVVELHILIAADGTVTDMQVVRGAQVLIQAARDAVGRWRYEPTYLGDQAVPTEDNVTIVFRLTTPSAAAPAK